MLAKIRLFFSDLKLNDTQGEVVLLLGVFSLIKGVYLISDENSLAPKTLKYVWQHYAIFIDNIFWGICWIITAVFCLIFAFKFDDRPALVALGAMLGGWTFAYLVDWVLSLFISSLGAANLNSFLLYLLLFVMVVRWHGRRSDELLVRRAIHYGEGWQQ